MAEKVGVVNSLDGGKFFVKDEEGEVRELLAGDIIYENDTIFGDGSNDPSVKIEVAIDGLDVVVLKNGEVQELDDTLIEQGLGADDLFFGRGETEDVMEKHFADRDIISDLREAYFKSSRKIAEFGNSKAVDDEDSNNNFRKDENGNEYKRTQSYNEASNNQILQNNSNKELGELPNSIVDKGTSNNDIPNRPSSNINKNNKDDDRPTSNGNLKNIEDDEDDKNTPPPTVTPPTVTPIANLSIDDITMYEQDGFMVFTVTLDIPASGNITVNFATSNGTAEAEKDYTPITGIITIPSGSSTAQIRVPINDDYYYEKSETFNVTLTNPTGNVNIVKPVGVGTILDNPPANNKPLDPNKPDSETGTYGEEDTVYAIIVGDKTVNEGDKSSYTIKLVDKDGNPVVVDKNTDVTVVYKNISTQDNDTQYKNGDKITVTIPKGSSEVKFEVQTKDDFYADNGENFNLSIEKVDTNEFENVVIGDKNGKNKDVTTEILDNTTTNPNNPSTNEKEQEQVVLKIVAADKDGNPIKGTDGNYLTQNEVPEGSDVYYVVLAFDPKATNFNDTTKLPIQEGKVEVETSNKTASGVNSQTKDDGTEDYISKKEIVELGKPISVKTLDDWKSDNNEQFEIKIIDKTYQHPSTPVYENVKTDTNPVITTIKDDTDTTPNNPNDNKIETNQEQVILKIVACDSTGNPIIENGKYVFANEVAEGSTAKYMVLAFHPNTTEFKTTDKLDVQDGKVTIKTADDTAKTTGTKDNAELDYKSETTKEVTLGTVFEVETLDDYLADDNETFKVSINDSSYKHPSTPIYENVKTDTSSVTTTIKDNTTTNPNNPSTNEKEQEQVVLKIVAADKDGNPIKGTDGNYLTQNEVPEGSDVYYVVLAFDPKATNFNDTTKLPIQEGKVEVETSNKTASGVNSQTKDDGTEDYISKKEIVELGKPISVKTLDDWKSDNNEQFEIKIIDKTYQHPSTPVYENVKTDTNPVITTIKDDTDTTPNNPNDNKIETNQEQVILKIVACDSTGNPIIENGKYVFANEVAEGSTAKYMVLAFHPNTTEFKTTDKLDVQDGKVTIKTADDTAKTTGTQNIGTKDFEVQTNTLVTLGQTFDINTLDDYIADNGEYFTVSINNNTYSHPSTPIYENVVTDTNPVTTTIKDNTTTGTEVDSEDVKIVLVAVTEADKDKTGDALKSAITKIDGTVDLDKNTNQTPEGGKLYYVAVAVDKDGKPLATQGGDVKLNYGTTTDTTDKDATAGTDYDSTKTTATIGTVFSVDAKDDYYAEGNEKFTVKITDLTNSPYETSTIDTTKDTVTSTITDNPANSMKPDGATGDDDPVNGSYGKEDTVYVKINNNAETLEGGKLSHTVTLVDKGGNVVTIPAGEKITVTLTYQSTNGVIDGDFSTIVKEVELVSNGTTFENITIVDNVYEGTENYTVTITGVKQEKGTYENVAIHQTENSATGKITDNPVKIILVATDSTGKIPLDGDGKVDLDKNTNQTPEGGKLYYVPVAIDS
ncbi:Calx-beta domain-containing protein, partial [Aliarcobacter cryaerophilus]|uniref:Calx-beta domain-containing protein n=1 Tax=Aliarcobacter cryaerophilus TaxID=28198 RepID=UPI003DA389C3